MIFDNKKKILSYALIIVIIAVSFSIGTAFEYSKRPWIERVSGVEHKEPQVVTSVDFEPFWKAWNIINEKSPDAGKLGDQDRVWGAVKGLVGSLNDPYSTFFPPEEAKQFAETIDNKFSGVGMEVGIKDKILTVVAPIKGSPAEKAGIKSGDKIFKIGNKITSEMTVDEAIKLIRGEAGTQVILTVYREGEIEPLTIKITRDIIKVPVVESKKRADGVYVISVYNFGTDVASLFQKELQGFVASGSTKLILDLRGNPGGLLEAAIDMSSWFLPQGASIVTEDFGSKGQPQTYRSRGYTLPVSNLKIAVLVDGGSASASEIMTGALQENGVAKVFGTQTFGKGSVQELVPLTADTAIKITVAKWLTPKGNSISEKGITPDIEVKITKDDLEKKRDPVLEKAAAYLLDK
jgi:carboxyl-terminal processing protease